MSKVQKTTNFVKFECLDTKEARILFGLLRKTYNSTILNTTNPFIQYIPKSLYENTKDSARAVKHYCAKNNQEVNFSTKKKGKLGGLHLNKSTITVKDGVIEFKAYKKEIPFRLTLKDSSLKDGVYTEAYITFEKHTPIIEINLNKIRTNKPGISKEVFEKLCSNKAKKVILDLLAHKHYKIKKAKRLFNSKGKESKEFLYALQDVDVSYKVNLYKAKFNLYLYIEELNKKYCSVGINGKIFSDNQAKDNSVFAKDSEQIVFDIFNTKYLTEVEKKELVKVFNIDI